MQKKYKKTSEKFKPKENITQTRWFAQLHMEGLQCEKVVQKCVVCDFQLSGTEQFAGPRKKTTHNKKPANKKQQKTICIDPQQREMQHEQDEAAVAP